MASNLNAVEFVTPTTTQTINVDDSFVFTIHPGFSGGGGANPYDLGTYSCKRWQFRTLHKRYKSAYRDN